MGTPEKKLWCRLMDSSENDDAINFNMELLSASALLGGMRKGA